MEERAESGEIVGVKERKGRAGKEKKGTKGRVREREEKSGGGVVSTREKARKRSGGRKHVLVGDRQIKTNIKE